MKASRVRATVGEISDALKGVGRYRANPQSVSGVYGAVVEEMDDWKALKADIDAFVAEEGRRPRIMIAKLGQDGHDRGAKVVASAFADLGFDIDVGPLFQTPEEGGTPRGRERCPRGRLFEPGGGSQDLVPAIIDSLRGHRARTTSSSSSAVSFLPRTTMRSTRPVPRDFRPGTPIQTSAREVLKQIRAARGKCNPIHPTSAACRAAAPGLVMNALHTPYPLKIRRSPRACWPVACVRWRRASP